MHRVVTTGDRTLRYVVPYGASNSSVRTRCLAWLDELSARSPGTRTSVSGPGFDGVTDESDCVVVLRNVHRFSRGRRESQVLRRAPLGVYELDDGLPWDDGRLAGHRSWRKRPWPRSLIARRAARSADRVIAGNPVLAEWASEHCRDVRVIPTCVRPQDYEPRTSWARGDVALIGWIGSPATEQYLWDIAEPLAEVCRRSSARLQIVSGPGTCPPALQTYVDRIEWTPHATTTIGRWDIGIMPLRDGPYERAKCGYKLLQYAASAVPAVGSPVGYNVNILSAMGAPSPTSGDDWVAVLSALLADESARRALAASGLAVAEQHSYERWFSAWSDAVGLGES